MRTLVFGYGNMDRQDDGAAWHVMVHIRRLLELPEPEEIDEDFSSSTDLVFVYQLQLTPEISEELVKFDRVCFIDAHSGSIPDEIRFVKVEPQFQHSPLTHHLTPDSLLAITNAVHQRYPQTLLLSIRGHEFQFTQSLSEKTNLLIPKASELIINWLNN